MLQYWKPQIELAVVLGGKYLTFLSSRSVKMRDSSAFSVCLFFEESVFIFQFLNDEMHNYVKHNCFSLKIET